MMKKGKKKAIMHDKQTTAVSLDLSYFLAWESKQMATLKYSFGINVQLLLMELKSHDNSLLNQLKILQKQKGIIRSQFMECIDDIFNSLVQTKEIIDTTYHRNDTDQVLNDTNKTENIFSQPYLKEPFSNVAGLIALIKLYLDPCCRPFRSSLIWLLDLIKKLKHHPVIRMSIAKVIVDILQRYYQKDITDVDNNVSNDSSFDFISTLNGVVNIDREFPCLDFSISFPEREGESSTLLLTEMIKFNDNHIVSHIISVVSKLFLGFVRNIQAIVERNTPDQHEMKANPVVGGTNSAQLLRIADSCVECMQIISMILRTRLKLHPFSADESCKSVFTNDQLNFEMNNKIPKNDFFNEMCLDDCVDQLLDSISLLLTVVDYLNNEVVTSTMLTATSIQWLHFIRSYAVRNPIPSTKDINITAGLLLTGILRGACIGKFEQVEPSSDENLQFCIEIGMHPKYHAICYNHNNTIIKCSLIRACLSVFEADALTFECNHDNPLLVDTSQSIVETVHRIKTRMAENIEYRGNRGNGPETSQCVLLHEIPCSIINACNNRLPNVKIYGIQSLMNWFNAVELHLNSLSEQSPVLPGFFPVLISRFLEVASGLVSLWSHPMRQVNHLVPAVFDRLLDIVQVTSMALKKGAFPVGDLMSDLWKELYHLVDMMRSNHRGKYQILKLLLPRVGPKVLLEVQPTIVDDLIKAVVGDRDIAASASSLMTSFLQSFYLQEQAVLSTLRKVWMSSVVKVLCSSSGRVRLNASNYLVPEMIKLDPTCGPHLIHSIRLYNELEKPNSTNKLWGMVSVLLHCRLANSIGSKLGKSESNVDTVDSDDAKRFENQLVTWNELVQAGVSNDDDLRLLALTAATASISTTATISIEDLAVLQQCFRFSLKTSDSDHRHKLGRIVKTLCIRARDAYQVNIRSIKNQEEKLSYLQSLSSSSESDKREQDRITQTAINQTTDGIEELKTLSVQSQATAKWLSQELVANLYPGCSSERELLTLELLTIAVECFTKNGSASNSGYSPLAQYFFSSPLTQIVMHLIVSKWDRSRILASDLLIQLPSPLHNFESDSEVDELLVSAIAKCGSARLRESDAGALLVRSIHNIYCIKLKWMIPSSAMQNTKQSTSISSNTSGIFIGHLCQQLSESITHLNDILSPMIVAPNELSQSDANYSNQPSERVNSTSELCHGLLEAIRHCIIDIEKNQLFQDPNCFEMWQQLLRINVLETTRRAFDIALSVVAEESSDVPFAPQIQGVNTESNPQSDPEVVVEGDQYGEVNDDAIEAATYINTNGLMGDLNAEQSSDIPNKQQKAVVAAWLIVKEASALFATLVAVSPPTLTPKEENSSMLQHNSIGIQLLSFEDISLIGETLLDALSRLKHMGAIAEVYAALQSISSTLLRHGDKSLALSSLPSKWLDQVLGRLNGDKQVYILRRSAGFAYSFLSLLRAEPSNCKPVLLHSAMKQLIECIHAGLRKDLNGFGTSSEVVLNGSNRNWKLAVHSLNVIRLILIDGAFGNDLDGYVEAIVLIAINGFLSRRWAIRNSSMMVFTAVLQRAVNPDKNESGRSVPTASEFFGRYTGLYDCLQSELTHLIKTSKPSASKLLASYSDESEQEVAKTLVDRIHQDLSSECSSASLHALLLLISKFRPSTGDGTQPFQDANSSITSAKTDGSPLDTPSGPNQVLSHDLGPFIGLVEDCLGNSSWSERFIAASALAALLPSDRIVSYAKQLIQKIVDSVSHGGTTSVNWIHGALETVHQLFQIICKSLGQSVVILVPSNPFRIHPDGNGTRRTSQSPWTDDANSNFDRTYMGQIVVQMQSDITPLLKALLLALNNGLPRSPALYSVLLRILRSIHIILLSAVNREGQVNSDGIEKERQQSDEVVYITTLQLLQCKIILSSLNFEQHDATPYQSVLFKEAAYIFTVLTMHSSTAGTSGARCSSLLNLMDCRQDTVREGVLEGLFLSLRCHEDTLCAPERELLLLKLLDRITKESSPPVLFLTVELLARLTRGLDFDTCSSEIQLAMLNNVRIFDAQWMQDRCDSTTQNEDSQYVHTATSQILLELAAFVIGGFTSQLFGGNTSDFPPTFFDLILFQWIPRLAGFASESSGYSARYSSALSLLGSKGLKVSPIDHRRLGQLSFDELHRLDKSCAISFEIWLLALKLLQDDDPEVRGLINGAICKEFKRMASSNMLMLSSLPMDRVMQWTNGMTDTDESLTLEMVSLPIGIILQQRFDIFSIHTLSSNHSDPSGSVASEDVGINKIYGSVSNLIERFEKEVYETALKPSEKIFEAELLNWFEEPMSYGKALMDVVTHFYDALITTEWQALSPSSMEPMVEGLMNSALQQCAWSLKHAMQSLQFLFPHNPVGQTASFASNSSRSDIPFTSHGFQYLLLSFKWVTMHLKVFQGVHHVWSNPECLVCINLLSDLKKVLAKFVQLCENDGISTNLAGIGIDQFEHAVTNYFAKLGYHPTLQIEIVNLFKIASIQ